MEQQIQMEAGTEKQFDYIARTLTNTNFDESLLHKIFEKMAAGIKAFEVAPDRPLYFGDDRLDLTVVVGPARSNPGNSVLQAIDATLVKAIQIPRVILQEEKGNILVNVPSLDERLSHPPTPKSLEPGLHDEFDAIKKKYEYEINRDLQNLMQKAPDVFNLVQAKHSFKVNFTVPKEHISAQAQLIADSVIHNRFPAYFNVTPMEIFGMLKNRQPVYKTLMVTNKEKITEDPKSRTYKAWIKVDFDSKKTDGSYEIKFVQTRKNATLMDALKKYNFQQLNHDIGTRQLLMHLHKGGLVDVDNGNPIGERRVRVAADPGLKMRIKLFTIDGAPIHNHNEYLREGLRKEVTDVVSLSIVDNRKGNRPQPATQRPVKTIVVPMTKEGQQPLGNKQQEHKARKVEDDTKKKSNAI